VSKMMRPLMVVGFQTMKNVQGGFSPLDVQTVKVALEAKSWRLQELLHEALCNADRRLRPRLKSRRLGRLVGLGHPFLHCDSRGLIARYILEIGWCREISP
jgi:hypothetical protein